MRAEESMESLLADFCLKNSPMLEKRLKRIRTMQRNDARRGSLCVKKRLGSRKNQSNLKKSNKRARERSRKSEGKKNRYPDLQRGVGGVLRQPI